LWGDPQWHAGVDPASVETQAGDGFLPLLLGVETCYAAKAVYSVACLEFCGALLQNTLWGAVARRAGDDRCEKPAWQKRLETVSGAVEENS